MKKLGALVIVGLAIILGLVAQHRKSAAPAGEKLPPAVAISNAFATASPQANAAINSSFAPASARVDVQPSPGEVSLPHAGPAHAPEITSMEPRIVLGNVRNAIANYGQRFGGNPVGSNAEITRALGGENPQQVNFINPDAGMRLNANGELIDAWGTPFFFHQLSGTEMEIHSAGPDKIMWTDDDLVTH